MLVLHKTVEN